MCFEVQKRFSSTERMVAMHASSHAVITHSHPHVHRCTPCKRALLQSPALGAYTHAFITPETFGMSYVTLVPTCQCNTLLHVLLAPVHQTQPALFSVQNNVQPCNSETQTEATSQMSPGRGRREVSRDGDMHPSPHHILRRLPLPSPTARQIARNRLDLYRPLSA